MGKLNLRALLSVSAVILALNLLFFTYGQHVIVPLLAALLLLFAIAGLGDALAAAFRVEAAGLLDKAGLGLMAASAYFFAAGYFRLLGSWTVLLFLAGALAVAAWRTARRRRATEWSAGLLTFFSRPLGEYAPFLLPLAYAALPPTFYDSLVYHLGIPNLYLQSGGFVATPQFVFANTFIYYEIALVPAVFLGDLVPRLFHFFLGALFVLAVADEAADSWGVRRRLTLVLALVSLPMTLFLLSTCKNDLIGAMFIFLALRRFRRGDWKLSAAFWGFAVGVKVFNLLPLALFAVFAYKPWKRADLRKLALMALIVIVAVSPLLVKNLRFTGNPFFPFLADVFPSDHWDSGRFQLMQDDVGAMVRAPADALRLPYDLSFFNHGYGGLVGPLFLAFLPFLLLAPLKDGKWLLWALLVLALAPFFTASLRFVYAAFVVLAIFAARAYEAAGGRLLKVVFHLLIALNFVMGFAMLEKFYQAHSLLGGAYSPEQYRERFFPAYPAIAYLNRTAPPQAQVLIVGETRNYFLKRPYRLSSALDHCIVKKYLADGASAPGFFAAIRRDGFSWLLVNFSELERLQAEYAILTAEEKERLLSFLGSRAPDFRRGAAGVYRLE